MANFIDKIKDAIFDPETISDIDDDMDMDMDNVMDSPVVEERVSNRRGKVAVLDKPNLQAMDGATSMKMILFQPLTFEESQMIVDNLRARKPVIVNMVDLDRELTQRLIDFMSGAVYALNGTIRRVSYGIFVIVPSNITIIGEGEEEDRDTLR